MRDAILSLAKSPQVPGRLEAVPAKRQFQVFVDYAHTPDALLNVLKTLRELSPRKLIVVFGCGGDRDRQKRPLMAAVVDQNADFSIITSDNPRKEDPEAIIAEVEKGFRSRALRKDHRSHASHRARHRPGAAARHRPDRRQRPRNLSGVCRHTVPFDDIQVARRALEDKPVEFDKNMEPLSLAQHRRIGRKASIAAGDPQTMIARISTDSRTLQRGDLFVPIRGEKFDGHKFVGQAAERGAAGAMVEENWSGSTPKTFALLRVPDTLVALSTNRGGLSKVSGPQSYRHYRQQRQDEHERFCRGGARRDVFASRKRKAISTITSACRARFWRAIPSTKSRSGNWA